MLRFSAEPNRAHALDAAGVARLSHGTTVGTNALIQRRGGKVALVTTDGFRDLLEIGRQTRPKVYDIHLDHPKPLVERALRLEVPERRRADGTVHRALDEDRLRALAGIIRSEGVDCVVVCFLHSYAYPEHEQRAVRILGEELPETVRIIASSEVYPEFREYERFSTAVLNGALLTTMGVYLDRLTGEVAGLGIDAEPKISQSAGGLMSVEMARRFPIRASLSGPAAGVLGAARRAAVAGFGDVITLDVGGTSADVSLLRGGRPNEVHERTLAGFPLRLPALDVNAVGAGGGSIAWIDRDGLLKVGPHSAGAVPGPACYATGGTEGIAIRVRVEIAGERIRFDFDGTAPQVRGNINVTMAGLQACCLYAVKVLVDPECPQNHGMLAPIEIRAPEGTIVNAAFPAASAARAQTGQRIADAILGALAGALPDRVVAAGNGANTAASFFGRGPDGRYYVYLETLGGGAGARSYADGTDGVQVHMTNTSNLPIEALENEYPLMVERYELVQDSGGAGRWRGGLGLRRVYRPIGHVVNFSGQGERCVNAPWGAFGGGPGATGRFELCSDAGGATRIANKPSSLEVGPDTSIVVTTAGAGGYGPPAERTAGALADDRRSEKFSPGYLERAYGVSG